MLAPLRSPALPLLLASLLASLFISAVPPAQDPLDELAAVEKQLERRPGDADLLSAAVDAAVAAGETDLALWYAALALEHSSGAKEVAERDDRLAELLSDLAGEAPLPKDLQAAQAETLFKLAKSAESKKLYVNAADLLARCTGTAFEERAAERLEKLFSKKKAVQALLASGMDVPVSTKRKMKPSEVARFDAKHATWDEPAEFKGKYYTVRTDMGYAYGTAFLEAMEQMNSFYRQVFDYKTRGQTMRRCVLHVYGSRVIFEQQEPSMKGKPSTRGFFVPGENRVAAYDRRTDGGTIDDLWSTLFHEASHQFTRAVWPGLIPTWLNEGTASYFEGAVLHPGGRVEKNLVPIGRLRSLQGLIRSEQVRLKNVITYFRPGSYPGEYYPYGWGLVYFCHNYENEKAERPYLPVYRDFMASYTGAAKHDVFERFNEYFVERAGVEGVDSFEDFEAKWSAWIADLAKVTFGGPEQADVLLERGARQLRFGRPEAAAETARRALDKRPGDTDALVLLAESLVDLEQEDGALLAWRQLDGRATELLDQDEELSQKLREQALAGMRQVDRNWANAFEKGERQLVQSADEGATAWLAAGSPRVALEVLSGAQQLLAGPSDLGVRAAEIEAEHRVSIRRWETLPFGAELDAWRAPAKWRVQEGTLVTAGAGLGACLWGEPVAAPFRLALEADLPADREGKYLGLVIGGEFGHTPQAFVLSLGQGRAGVLDSSGGAPTLVLRQAVKLEGDQLSLLVLADDQGARFFVNGEEAAWERVSAGAKAPGGTIGIIAEGEGLHVLGARVQR